ncbi:MAG TPA: carboxyl transferase domain-containing protein [Acidimicrobiia bacterium]|nr:carboxyl transferase domain-containing protein [Acidimicrobiia bacterium]
MTINSEPITSTNESPFLAHHCQVAQSNIKTIDDRKVSVLELGGGNRHGAITSADADAMKRAAELSGSLGIPFLLVLDTSGADITEGPAGLHAWGTFAAELARLSGVVPTTAIVTGACVSGPSLVLGLVDHVIMTKDAFAYVSGPDSVKEFTGIDVSRAELGSTELHSTSGVASLIVEDLEAAMESFSILLEYLPSNHVENPARFSCDDDITRSCDNAAQSVPDSPNASYDVREVIEDIVDKESLFEIRPQYAPNMVTSFARIDGISIGIIANQPNARAGTIDIEASRKAARFVAFCDAFNIAIVTFVDTPGFEPGKDLEWRGMIRHGAELVYAYAQASVPRICIILRKSYGGAYIVMDSKNLGNDWCAAWPNAEIAVMGASGAVAILNRKQLGVVEDEAKRDELRKQLIAEYETQFSNPNQAAGLGYVDAIIDPASTRALIATVLGSLSTKRETPSMRKHGNSPL